MPKKKSNFISVKELEFCRLMAIEGLGAIKAARLAFGWDCDEHSQEYRRARYLATTPRICDKIEELKKAAIQQVEASRVLTTTSDIDVENLREFVYKKLEAYRDDPELSSTAKFKAIEALEQLSDPSRDTNLIFKWMDIIIRGLMAHCPSCHNSFPAEEINIPKLKQYRYDSNSKFNFPQEDLYSRRKEIFKLADKRIEPGADQIIALSAKERHLIFAGPARSGKVIKPETPIITTKGWKLYKDLQFGDILFNEEGKETTVIGFSPICFDGQWYEVEFDNGEKIVCHENHSWLTHTYKYRATIHRRKGTDFYARRHRKVKNRSPNQGLENYKRIKLFPTVASTKEIKDTLYARIKHSNHAIPVTGPIQLCTQELPIDPYTLGVWLGDGCRLTGTIGIDNRDREIMDYITYDLLSQRIETKNRMNPLLIFRIKNFYRLLRQNNLLKNKHIPSLYLIGDINQRLSLVRGLMDTDGTIDKKGRCSFNNNNKDLVDSLEELLASLGIKSGRSESTGKCNGKEYGLSYRLHFTTTLPVFKLKRKLQRIPKKVKNTTKYHYIINVKAVTPSYGRCVMVSGRSGLYLASRSMIPTHNSLCMSYLALLYFLTPGTESWILARIYSDARSEVEYLLNFLETLFYPYSKFLFTKYYDSKTEETVLTSRWKSELRIKSAKAVGSLTAREVDAVFAAEPGWLPDNIFNHVRARLSSRLGRIFAFGTPQSLGGFLSRLIFATGRDPTTGQVRRLKPEERLLKNGCKWGLSALVGDLRAENNPAYVKSELETARQELSDEEYESEFEGKMVSQGGMTFGLVKQHHLVEVDRHNLLEASWVFGIDQGEKNFAGCLVAYDGDKCYVMRDFFEGEIRTIRTNLLNLRHDIPIWIKSLDSESNNWKLTIFDQEILSI